MQEEKVREIIEQMHLGKHINDMTKKWFSQTPSLPRYIQSALAENNFYIKSYHLLQKGKILCDKLVKAKIQLPSFSVWIINNKATSHK